MQNRYRRANRRKYNLNAHIVLVTKYRKVLLQYGIDDFTKRAMEYIADNIIAIETDKDHIHILLQYNITERVFGIISIIERQTTHYLWIRYKTYLSEQY